MFTEKERKLLVALLKMAADEFSNHGCNDFDVRGLGFSPADCRDLWQKLADWDDPELAQRGDSHYFWDWMLLSYFADKVAHGES